MFELLPLLFDRKQNFCLINSSNCQLFDDDDQTISISVLQTNKFAAFDESQQLKS